MRKNVAYITLIFSELKRQKQNNWKFRYKDLNGIIHTQALIPLKNTQYLKRNRRKEDRSPVWELTELGREIARKTLNSVTEEEIKQILYKR